MKNKILKAGAIGILTPAIATSAVIVANADASNINSDIQSRMITSTMNEVGVADIKSGTNLNIRASYGTSSKIIGKIPAGKTVTITGKVNGWYKVKYNGVEGYSSANYIRLVGSSQNTSNTEEYVSGNGKVANISSRLNVRSKATTSSDIIGKLNNGQVVKLISKTSSGWYKIEFNNTVGYVCGDYITKTSEQTSTISDSTSTSKVGKIATVTASALNVRSGAGTNYSVVNKLYKGNDVKILDVASNGWNKVQLSSGVTGWVSGSYLTNYREGNLSSASQGQSNSSSSATSNQKIDAVINIAKSKLGCKYEWGAEGPNRFDCSGLVYYAFKNGAGITLPRTSSAQATAGYAVSKSNLKPGDLVFFNTSGKGISHVGIYIGNDEMIHSPNSNDVVKVSKINSSYYSSRFVTARRIIG